MASSSARDDQVVSRASVILENQSDWKLWYSLKKEFAVKDTASDSAWRRWEIKTNAQKATLKAIGEVNLEITRTVARSKLHLITNLDLDDRELLKKIKKLYKDNNVRWTFDTAQNSDRSEKKTENKTENKTDRPTSASRGRRPYADRIDDNDSNGDYYANNAFHLAQITTPKGDTLLDRWIVDPGSNVHICNSTYFNWRTTSNAKSTDVIFAGATSYQVAAWGGDHQC
ncbi:hypothetical protein A1F94_007125 [Pyrenophora tritici-repentis]|nr:hypothetical protein A1F94_007125 [Pyrenophora tritici-repentis]